MISGPLENPTVPIRTVDLPKRDWRHTRHRETLPVQTSIQTQTPRQWAPRTSFRHTSLYRNGFSLYPRCNKPPLHHLSKAWDRLSCCLAFAVLPLPGCVSAAYLRLKSRRTADAPTISVMLYTGTSNRRNEIHCPKVKAFSFFRLRSSKLRSPISCLDLMMRRVPQVRAHKSQKICISHLAYA